MPHVLYSFRYIFKIFSYQKLEIKYKNCVSLYFVFSSFLMYAIFKYINEEEEKLSILEAKYPIFKQITQKSCLNVCTHVCVCVCVCMGVCMKERQTGQRERFYFIKEPFREIWQTLWISLIFNFLSVQKIEKYLDH